MNSSPSRTNSNPTEASSTTATSPATDATNRPMRNYDGTEMRDANGHVVYRSQFLSTHPLREDCKEKPGFGGKKFTYVTGDGVIRTMNAIFGNGGWSSRILDKELIQSEKDDRGRWYVGYLVTVRLSLHGSDSSHEDCGSGEGINPSKIQAHDKALKSAVTDALKRAARHYGERLGNALYVKGNGIRTAPRTNGEALEVLERRDCSNLFGDQGALRDRCKEEEIRQKQSAAVGGDGNTASAIMKQPALVASMPANQPPTPVISTIAPQQQRTYNSGTLVSTNPLNGPSSLAATVPHNQYKPISAPVMPQRHHYSTNNSNSNANNNRSNTWNNSNNAHNPTKMPPPQPVTRGISPENAPGVIPDASKRTLPAVPVQNHLGSNSTVDCDGNKRQKRNPYTNNRLSC